MAIDFSSISRKAKSDHEARIAEQKKKHDDERSQHLRNAEENRRFLQAEIEPLLADAHTAFSEDGVSLDITHDYDVEIYVSKMPSIKIQLSQAVPGRSDGYRIKSGEAILSGLRSNFTSTIKSFSDSRSSEEKLQGPPEQCVENTLRKLADFFYKAKEQNRP